MEGSYVGYVGQDSDILPLVPDYLIQATIPHVQSKISLPPASEISSQRQIRVRALCKSCTQLSENPQSTEYKVKWNDVVDCRRL